MTKDVDLVALAERLRPVVAAIGTQADAADAAGISVAQLKNYLAAKSVPSIPPIARLCAATGYALEWVVWGVGSQPSTRGESVAGGSGTLRGASSEEAEGIVRELLHAAGFWSAFESDQIRRDQVMQIHAATTRAILSEDRAAWAAAAKVVVAGQAAVVRAVLGSSAE